MKPALEHPSRIQLMAFMWGQLSERDQEAVANHIAGCDACCILLREIPDAPCLARLRGEDLPRESEIFIPSLAGEQALPKELQDHPRYKVGRFLGAGGMGLVYQAEHRLMDRQVALKIIHPHLIRHPYIVERFRQEVKAAARLSHANIVAAYDAEQAGDVHFLVMEYVDGMTLDRVVRKQGALEYSHACQFVRQAARGLQHAFEIGMVHRDIKPHNLMLTRKCQVKILDFGLARLASESRTDLKMSGLAQRTQRPGLTIVGDVMGTPEYMAPEQAIDPRQADIRADIYSLGCTLYYLLWGQPPIAGQTGRAKKELPKPRPSRTTSELRSDIPDELLAIVHKMMAWELAERFQTPAEAVKALAPFAKAAPVQKTEPKKKQGRAEETGRVEPGFFPANCPFCQAKHRVPDKVLGWSIRCPQCGSYFTAVP